MSRYIRDTAILAKIEGTPGTDAVPTGGANAIYVSNVNITPVDARYVSRDALRPYFGGSEKLLSTVNKAVSFDVEAVGSGTAGDAPAWGPLLRACGFAETETASTRVDYLPVTNSQESVTIYVYDSGVLHKYLFAKGRVELMLKQGELPKFKFSFIAVDGGDEAGTVSGYDISMWQTPQVVTNQNTADLTFGATCSTSGAPALSGGTTYCSTGLDLNFGNEVNYIPLLGCESVEVTGREVVGKAMLSLTAAQEISFLSTIAAGTTQSVGLQHGTVTGKKFLVFGAHAQITEPSKDELTGRRMNGYTLNFIPGSSGNDEIRIVTSF